MDENGRKYYSINKALSEKELEKSVGFKWHFIEIVPVGRPLK